MHRANHWRRTGPVWCGIGLLALRSLQSPVDTEWGALMTGSAIAALPLVILFVTSSKQLISGLTTGAVK